MDEKEIKTLAKEVIDCLESAGMRLSIRSLKSVDETIEEILTVPAVKAYKLEEVVATLQ